jgi:hypothetical protein
MTTATKHAPMTHAERLAIKPRTLSIECIDHPEWGTWGVMEDNGQWFEIYGRSGGRVLHYSEAEQFWRIVPR